MNHMNQDHLTSCCAVCCAAPDEVDHCPLNTEWADDGDDWEEDNCLWLLLEERKDQERYEALLAAGQQPTPPPPWIDALINKGGSKFSTASTPHHPASPLRANPAPVQREMGASGDSARPVPSV